MQQDLPSQGGMYAFLHQILTRTYYCCKALNQRGSAQVMNIYLDMGFIDYFFAKFIKLGNNQKFRFRVRLKPKI